MQNLRVKEEVIIISQGYIWIYKMDNDVKRKLPLFHNSIFKQLDFNFLIPIKWYNCPWTYLSLLYFLWTKKKKKQKQQMFGSHLKELS